MSESPSPPPRLQGPVLVAVDGSEHAVRAAYAAADLAARTGVALHVVHVVREPVEEWGTPIETLLAFRERRGTRLLRDHVDELHHEGFAVEEAHLCSGSAVDEVLALADRLDASLVVVGSGGAHHPALGSTSEGLVHHAHRPVLVVRGDSDWPPQRVVVGDDTSQSACHAALLAATVARACGSRLLVLHGLPDLADLLDDGGGVDETRVAELLHGAESGLEERARELAPPLGVRPGVRVVVDQPAAALLDTAGEAGGPALVAVGSRGLSAMQRLRLGSVSTQVLRGAAGPVLVVPPPADRSS